VLLLSCPLVLATLLPLIESAFGGLDKVVVWHRRAAVAGVLLLIPHVALVMSPADPNATSLGSGLGVVALLGIAALALWALAPSLRAARWPGPVRRLAPASYERWLTAHRLTGLFVAAAVVHGAIVDPVLHRSTLLRLLFLVVDGIGVAAYPPRGSAGARGLGTNTVARGMRANSSAMRLTEQIPHRPRRSSNLPSIEYPAAQPPYSPTLTGA
jgi:predicted ferric reductase